MSKIAIITAIYDSYDTLKPTLPQSIEVEWICVTDNPHLIDEGEEKGWNVFFEPRPHLHPNRAAKTPKCLPWLYTDCNASIWIDASYKVKSWVFAEDAMAHANPIAQYTHPWRNCVYAEADESIKLPKYKDQIEVIKNQAWDLRNVYGHPRDYGLWATGVIARKHTKPVMSMGFDWLHQIYMYSYQDQISHPNCVRMHIGEHPTAFSGTHLANQWLDYQGSGRH